MSHSSFHGGQPIVSASAVGIASAGASVPACGVMGADGTWHNEHEVPRTLTTAEVEGVVADFGRAAELAVQAGFDGVEIHAASGYLLDCFLQSCSNKRTDKYGGDASGRFTMLAEVIAAVTQHLPASKVGVKLSPNSGFNGMGSADNHADFIHYAARLSDLGVGYLHVQDGVGTNTAAAWFGKVATDGFHAQSEPVTLSQLRRVFHSGGLVGNGGYTRESAAAAVARGDATAISFGRAYMSNPDLAERMQRAEPLAPLPPKEAWFEPSSKYRDDPSWGYTNLGAVKETYAITGANGFIACSLIKHLVAQGHRVRGTVRDAARDGDHLRALGASVVEVQSLGDRKALGTAFAGVDGVFHMAAVHPEYGFTDTAEGRAAILSCAVDGTLSVLSAAKDAGVARVVLTSSLAAVECGNDEAVLSESTWSRAEVYDSQDKLLNTQWATHYTYVKSKVEQERAASDFARVHGIDLRVVVPGNLCIGPIASRAINGTMTRVRDIVQGRNTLKGAADLAIVHVEDVVEVHAACMREHGASGRYIVAGDMVPIEEVFAALKQSYPQLPIAEMSDMDSTSGLPHKARRIESRVVSELGFKLRPYTEALKDSVDSMIAKSVVAVPVA